MLLGKHNHFTKKTNTQAKKLGVTENLFSELSKCVKKTHKILNFQAPQPKHQFIHKEKKDFTFFFNNWRWLHFPCKGDWVGVKQTLNVLFEKQH